MSEIIRPSQPELGDPQVERNPQFKEAVQRADSIIEKMQFSEAIKVIDELLAEIDEMPIATRFSKTKKMKENAAQIVHLAMDKGEMTEEEYKRQQLRSHLNTMKQRIFAEIGSMKEIILDIEATKKDF